jgi:hypothetical protein
MSVTPENNPEAVSPELGNGSETEHVEDTKGSLERNLVPILTTYPFGKS